MSDEIIEEKPELVAESELPTAPVLVANPIVKEPTIEEQNESRAKELRAYKGKFFRQKNSPKAPIVEIIDYGGIKKKTVVKDGQIGIEESHTFVCEMHGARWTPAATAFLTANEEVNPPVKFTKQPAI